MDVVTRIDTVQNEKTTPSGGRFQLRNPAAFHLGTTAGAHFGDLLAIATPGPFFFLGPVPEELQQGALQMGLAAEFGTHVAGYDRALV